MQLHEFSKEQLQDMLAAVHKTKELHQYALDHDISYFTAKRRLMVQCPLCEFGAGDCRPCPWMVLEGHTCEDYEMSARSIMRLERWEDQIKEAIHAES